MRIPEKNVKAGYSYLQGIHSGQVQRLQWVLLNQLQTLCLNLGLPHTRSRYQGCKLLQVEKSPPSQYPPHHPNEIMLYNLVCYVTLTSSNNSVKKEPIFQRDSKQNYLVNSGNVLLRCVLKKYEIEKLVKWRNAGIVTIKWQFYGSGQVE